MKIDQIVSLPMVATKLELALGVTTYCFFFLTSIVLLVSGDSSCRFSEPSGHITFSGHVSLSFSEKYFSGKLEIARITSAGLAAFSNGSVTLGASLSRPRFYVGE